MKEFASVCIYLDHIYITIVLYFISTSLILSISILSNAVGFSITIQFGHAALITLNISSADLTSDFNMSGHSIFFGIVDCPFRYIRSFFFLEYLSFIIISIPAIDFNPVDEYVVSPVFFLCISYSFM